MVVGSLCLNWGKIELLLDGVVVDEEKVGLRFLFAIGGWFWILHVGFVEVISWSKRRMLSTLALDQGMILDFLMLFFLD